MRRLFSVGQEIIGEVVEAIEQRGPRSVLGKQDDQSLESPYIYVGSFKTAVFGESDCLASSVYEESCGLHGLHFLSQVIDTIVYTNYERQSQQISWGQKNGAPNIRLDLTAIFLRQCPIGRVSFCCRSAVRVGQNNEI